MWDTCGNAADLSVMNQYTPNDTCRKAGGDLARAVTDEEYEIVLCHADDLGFENIWWQEGGTVSESFVPASMPRGSRGRSFLVPKKRRHRCPAATKGYRLSICRQSCACRAPTMEVPCQRTRPSPTRRGQSSRSFVPRRAAREEGPGGGSRAR